MSSNSKKYFAPIANFGALRELQEKYKKKPSEEDIRHFLDFWQSAYDMWRSEYSPFDFKYLEEKIKVRKSLIEKFGFRH